MAAAWPAICTAVALVLLLYLIIRHKFEAFAALLLVSIGLGLAAGMAPDKVLDAVGKGVGDILASVAVILGLGAMLGRMLEASGAAEVIARTLIRAFGPARASWAILIAAYIIGIPVFFNVGFLLLIPIVWRLQRETGKSLLWYALPLGFSLANAHSLIPPHPGIVAAVGIMKADMVLTMIFGTLLGIPLVFVGWFGPGRWWARRQFVTVPEHLAAKNPPVSSESATVKPPSFVLSVCIVLLPLVLSVVGFGAKLLTDLNYWPAWMTQPMMDRESGFPAFAFLTHPPVAWLRFLGQPEMALFIPTGLAFFALGMRRGMGSHQLSKIAGNALQDVGGMALMIGAAGALKQVIQSSGAGDYIARLVMAASLSPVLIAFLVAVMMRAALGSATAAITTAAGLMVDVVKELPGQATLLLLAVATGVTFMTQPGDSGFWMVKEYCNLSVKQVMLSYNLCRAVMALTGLAILLLVEVCIRPV